MKKLVVLFSLLALLLALAPAALAQDGVETLCLVTDLGRVNDGTFNQFAHDGASEAADEYDLEYKFIETQAETDYEANIQTCIDEGFEVIITVGFLIADATRAAAEDNPAVYFLGVGPICGGWADELCRHPIPRRPVGLFGWRAGGASRRLHWLGHCRWRLWHRYSAGQEIPQRASSRARIISTQS